MNDFIELRKADRQPLWLRIKDITGISEHAIKGSYVYVQGQAQEFLVQDAPETIFDRLAQAGAK